MSGFLDNENGHVWHGRVFSSMQIKCCMNCGFIKNEQQPNKPCPGPVSVELRNQTPQSGAQGSAPSASGVAE